MSTAEKVADKLLGIDLKWHTLKILTVSTAMISNATGVALSDRNHYLKVPGMPGSRALARRSEGL